MRHVFRMMVAWSVVVLSMAASSARAQSVIDPPMRNKTVNLSGPRFGMTALGQGVVDELARRSITVGPNISQFGWQFVQHATALSRGGRPTAPASACSGWGRA